MVKSEMITKIREGLYLGDASAQLDLAEPTFTLDLTGWGFDLEPMKNDAQHIEVSRIVGTIKNIRDAHIPVLVKCHGGIDRSPFIVACYLTLETWLETGNWIGHMIYADGVKRLHPATFIHDDWMSWWLHKL